MTAAEQQRRLAARASIGLPADPRILDWANVGARHPGYGLRAAEQAKRHAARQNAMAIAAKAVRDALRRSR